MQAVRCGAESASCQVAIVAGVWDCTVVLGGVPRQRYGVDRRGPSGGVTALAIVTASGLSMTLTVAGQSITPWLKTASSTMASQAELGYQLVPIVPNGNTVST